MLLCVDRVWLAIYWRQNTRPEHSSSNGRNYQSEKLLDVNALLDLYFNWKMGMYRPVLEKMKPQVCFFSKKTFSSFVFLM